MPNSHTPTISVDALMAQVQVFASAWSSVDGPFDDGTMLETAEAEKAVLREMLERFHVQVGVLEVQLAGANLRAQMLLRAKELWRKRAGPVLVQPPSWDGQIQPSDFEVNTFVPPGARSGWVRVSPVGVQVRHQPTGLTVACCDHRSLHANKEAAWNRLIEHLQDLAVTVVKPS